jgi:hypothetical protein
VPSLSQDVDEFGRCRRPDYTFFIYHHHSGVSYKGRKHRQTNKNRWLLYGLTCPWERPRAVGRDRRGRQASRPGPCPWSSRSPQGGHPIGAAEPLTAFAAWAHSGLACDCMRRLRIPCPRQARLSTSRLREAARFERKLARQRVKVWLSTSKEIMTTRRWTSRSSSLPVHNAHPEILANIRCDKTACSPGVTLIAFRLIVLEGKDARHEVWCQPLSSLSQRQRGAEPIPPANSTNMAAIFAWAEHSALLEGGNCDSVHAHTDTDIMHRLFESVAVYDTVLLFS